MNYIIHKRVTLHAFDKVTGKTVAVELRPLINVEGIDINDKYISKEGRIYRKWEDPRTDFCHFFEVPVQTKEAAGGFEGYSYYTLGKIRVSTESAKNLADFVFSISDYEEKFKDVKGYEGLYKISNFGTVLSFYDTKHKGKVCPVPQRALRKYYSNTNVTTWGSLLEEPSVYLRKNGRKKRFSIKQLVAENFCDYVHTPKSKSLRRTFFYPVMTTMWNLTWD